MRRSIRPQVLALIDLSLVAVATLGALALRDNLEVSLAALQRFLPYLAITLLTAAVVLPVSGIDRTIWRFSTINDYLRVVATVFIIVLGAVAFGFLINRLEGVARALPVIQGLLMAFMLVGARAAIRLRHAGRQQQTDAPVALATHETVLLVGLNAVTELFLRSVAELARDRVKVAGIVTKSGRHRGRSVRQHQVLGAPEEIEPILRTLEVHGISVDRIVVTMPFADLSAAARAALLDVERKTDIRLDLFAERIGLAEPSRPLPDAPEPQAAKDYEPEPEIAFSAEDLEATLRRPYMRLKRVFDFTLAAALMVLMMPVIVLIGLVVAFDVGLPTVFWQQRPGARGRPFKLYKFRTMRSAHDEQGLRIPDDERLSAIGRFLRRTRLDELPQLYNILIGEMSFVGPRPLLPADQSADFAARLMAQPGLTGWAQVKGGREISASDKAALDVWYLRNASLWLDISILARTIPTIVFGERTEAEAIRQAWDDLAQATGRSRAGRWQPAA